MNESESTLSKVPAEAAVEAPAAAEEKPLAVEAPAADSGEARVERKEAAQKVYAANPPDTSRAARKARGPKE